jgi:hypothetical protein
VSGSRLYGIPAFTAHPDDLKKRIARFYKCQAVRRVADVLSVSVGFVRYIGNYGRYGRVTDPYASNRKCGHILTFGRGLRQCPLENETIHLFRRS